MYMYMVIPISTQSNVMKTIVNKINENMQMFKSSIRSTEKWNRKMRNRGYNQTTNNEQAVETLNNNYFFKVRKHLLPLKQLKFR